MSDEDPYDMAMKAAVMPELQQLLEEQTRRFQKAALPFFRDGTEPAWLHAWDAAGFRLQERCTAARKTVYDELNKANPEKTQ